MTVFFPEGWKTEKDFYSENNLAEAKFTGRILQSNAIMCDNRHNLIVDLGCRRGVIPREEGALGIADGSVRDIALISRVGKPVCFTVSSLLPDGTALLSRKRAQERCKAEYIATLRAGDIINAKVTHLEPFGAFCDIGCGIVALLPIDAISVSRIFHPSDRLRAGDNLKVVIKSIAYDGRITLSLKELLGTWEENAALFEQGQTVSGVVRSVEEYGIFVELTPNLAGLAEPKEDVYVSDKTSVYIKSIIPDKMKVKLIIIDSFSSDYSPPMKYFIESGRLTRWQYSPKDCPRKIVTQF